MADHDIRVLQTLAALVARSADRYEAAANAAEDARLVTPLNDRANERRRAAAALEETAHELGATPGHAGLSGSIARAADGIRAAFAGSGDRAMLQSLASLEDELAAAFRNALDDADLAPAVRGEIDAISGSLGDARDSLRGLLAGHAAP